MAGWFVGYEHGVETAGSEEMGVHFVEEVVCPVGGGWYDMTRRSWD